MSDLTGKHALVTGGGTGIGAAISLQLANAGASVTISGRNLKLLKQHCKKHPQLHAISANITNPDEVANLFTSARKKFGALDIVVANAGVGEAAPLDKTSIEVWNAIIAVNLTGTFLTLKHAAPDMITNKWGRMITISSTAGLKGSSYISAYSASKHGVIGLTRSLAVELAQTGITVNAICPGFTQTQMYSTSIANIVKKTGKSEQQAHQILADSNPMGRIIQPEEVAHAVMWLLGPGSDVITGQAISVSGGETW